MVTVASLTAVPESEPESSSVSVYFAPLTPMDAALMSDKYHNYSWHTTDQSGTRIKLIQPFFSVRLSDKYKKYLGNDFT